MSTPREWRPKAIDAQALMPLLHLTRPHDSGTMLRCTHVPRELRAATTSLRGSQATAVSPARRKVDDAAAPAFATNPFAHSAFPWRARAPQPTASNGKPASAASIESPGAKSSGGSPGAESPGGESPGAATFDDQPVALMRSAPVCDLAPNFPALKSSRWQTQRRPA
jgi:hypothetical protein